MSSLNNIMTRSFAQVNLLTISMVEDTEAKEYSNKFYMFIKASPGVKSENSPTGKTYDTKSSVTFKIEAEKALSMAFAFKCYANGKGPAYDQTFGSFEIFADASRSQYGGSGKKSCKIASGVNNKTNKSVINLFFNSEGGKPVGFFLTPYEAYAISEILEFLAKKCLEYEINGRSGVTVNKTQFPQKNIQKISNENMPETHAPNLSHPTTQFLETTESVSSNFQNLFNNPFES